MRFLLLSPNLIDISESFTSQYLLSTNEPSKRLLNSFPIAKLPHNQDCHTCKQKEENQCHKSKELNQQKMKMHVSEKNSNEQPEMVLCSNTKEYGPMGQLAALRVEFDEFKRSSAAEKAGLISERDNLAQKVDLLTEQVKEASMLGEWMLEVKTNNEESKESEDTACKMKEEENTDDAKRDMIESSETLVKSIPNFDAGVRTQVEVGTKIPLDSVANHCDEDGYIKVLLPGDENSKRNRNITFPTSKDLADACDIVKNHVEDCAQQVLASVADQFDEEGYIKALLPGSESNVTRMPALPTTKELVDACDAVKNHIKGESQQVLVSVADQFDENGFMKCCLAQE